jgi:hypothetical protein
MENNNTGPKKDRIRKLLLEGKYKKIAGEYFVETTANSKVILTFLHNFLKDNDCRVRDNAVLVICTIAKKSCGQLLILLKDNVWQVGSSATLALGEIGKK